MTNTSNLPVESLETEYPLMVEAYELIDDSGGMGEFRGGLGIRRRIRTEAEEIHFWLDTSRQRSKPWGLFGGGPGTSARCELSEDARPIDRGYTVLQPGQTVTIETAGAGGYGPPAARPEKWVEQDRRGGKISARTVDRYAVARQEVWVGTAQAGRAVDDRTRSRAGSRTSSPLPST